jgi:hypothetical protein
MPEKAEPYADYVVCPTCGRDEYGERFHDPVPPAESVRPPWWEYDPNWKPEDDAPQFEPWPDNLPLEAQVERLAAVLLAHYEDAFDRSEGAMEKAARLLWERAQFDGHVGGDTA